jgi:hypothetical protein
LGKLAKLCQEDPISVKNRNGGIIKSIFFYFARMFGVAGKKQKKNGTRVFGEKL